MGLDKAFVLDAEPNGILIFRNLADALIQAELLLNYFVFGIVPAGGMLQSTERKIGREAIPAIRPRALS